MIEEGRFSRAMAKANAAGKAVTAPEEQSALTAAAKVAEKPKEDVPCRRVTGVAGPPAPNAVVYIDSAGEVATQIRGLRTKLLALNNGTPPRNVDNTGRWTVGSADGVWYYAGLIDEFVMWNTALTDRNIEWLATHTMRPPPAGTLVILR